MRVVVILSLLFTIWSCRERKECTKTAIVAAVGGCDRYGNCGITALTDEGRVTAVVKYPTVGQEICISR